jgi:methylmalonyl-CoA mutase N-terminal domain/subunit
MGEKIDQAKKSWETTVLAEWLDRNPESRSSFTTKSGLALERLYAPGDGRDDYLSKLNFPGQFPFTRGVCPNGYRSRPWVMGQYSGYGSAEEANARFRYLIEQGQTGFSIALDLPTQVGLDSDDPSACGEVGRVGVAIDSLEDVETLLQGIPFEKVRQIRTTANAISPIVAALFIANAQKNGVDPNSIGIFIQNDILKEYIGRGTYIFPPQPSVKLAVDVIQYCARNLPNWTPMAICGYHIRDSGSSAVQEVAFTFANAVAYMEEAIRRGVAVDDFAPSLYAFFGSDIDLLEEVAKFRAARRVWAHLLKERFGAGNPASCRLNIFAYTLGSALTAQQPMNNVVRVTIAALAAALGGVQTLATSSYDEAFCLPTQEAVTLSLRTQQVIATESGIVGTADALGGSYVVEALTDTIEAQVLEILKHIDEQGGAVNCIDRGTIQQEVSEAAYALQKRIETGERPLVGVNVYTTDDKAKIPVFTIDEAMEDRQIERLRALKDRRDNEAVRSCLLSVEKAARNDENTIPSMIEAVKQYATIGEICGVLREVYGSYQDPAQF